MMYASVAEGFRSGGFNVYGYETTQPDLPAYDPESIRNHEIGTKLTLAGGRVAIEGAAFFTKYDDMLRRGLVFDQTLGVISVTSNIGEAEIKGLEAAVTWQATPALTLNASAAFLDAEVTALVSEGEPEDRVNFPGDSLDYVPDLSYTLGANYAFTIAGGRPAFLRVDYNHRDEVTYTDRSSFPAANLPQLSDAFDLLNIRAGVEVNDVDLELYAMNVSDVNKSVDPYQAWANANRTRPRVVGFKIGYQF
jgi:outer membrane receptor protein involved in Fe transport